ncbi:MAG: VOC family protein [Chloroflexi bacterium]|nr:VOC family protein [Chloroflexota bacterium]
MLTGVHHTSFTVADMERSLAFYRDVLGLEVIRDQEGSAEYLARITGLPGARLRIVHLRLARGSEHVLELMQYREPVGRPIEARTCDPGSAHLCFLTDNIWAAYEHLTAHGVRVRSEPILITAGQNAGGYSLYFLDPDGITLELFQRPPASGDRP